LFVPVLEGIITPLNTIEDNLLKLAGETSYIISISMRYWQFYYPGKAFWGGKGQIRR
jgi:hypothetical protein